jgi:hypothetical protein
MFPWGWRLNARGVRQIPGLAGALRIDTLPSWSRRKPHVRSVAPPALAVGSRGLLCPLGHSIDGLWRRRVPRHDPSLRQPVSHDAGAPDEPVR